MNDEVGILGTQTEAMLAELRRHGVEQVNELIDSAQLRAQESIREAHRTARQTMHEAIATERRRLKRSSVMAEAAQQTKQRLLSEAKAKQLLRRGWQQLPEVLQRHWEDTHARRQWCETLIQDAAQAFGAVDLRVEHPATLSAEEKDRLQAIAKDRGAEATFAARQGISCGLIISFKGAILDGTIDGLLADRRYVEARLLDEINRTRQGEGANQIRGGAESHV